MQEESRNGSAASTVRECAAAFGQDPARLMDIALAVQARLGHLSEGTIGLLADTLGVPRGRVRDCVSFYSFFEREARGATVIRVCDAVSERMQGAAAVVAAFEAALGIRVGETTACDGFTLLHTACMGMSDQGPSALVNGVPLVKIRVEDVPGIVEALRKGTAPSALPQAQIAQNIRKRGEVVLAAMARGAGLRNAIGMSPEDVINAITKAGLRGRGGAGFPTGMKWNFCRKAKGECHYVICNADEGEPGTFKDRAILTEYADTLFEGMAVAGYAIGAEQGLVYLRGEYAYLLPALEDCLTQRRADGLLGEGILGKPGFNFDIRIQLGAGAYICGEESALIESLEGKRGAPRDRPPFPVQKGYKGQPTSVNNVETLCCAARILERGAAWFAAMGTKDSTGTKVLSISGDCATPGVYEVEYGLTVASMLGLAGAVDVQAVQIGGPSGQCIGPKDFGKQIAFEALPTGGSIIIFGKGRHLLELMAAFSEFFVEESCGWCAPCRVGTTLLRNKFSQVLAGRADQSDLDTLKELGESVKAMSRCGLGQTAANPILSTLAHFPELYEERLSDRGIRRSLSEFPEQYQVRKREEGFLPGFDLGGAMQACCDAAGRKRSHEEVHG